MLKRTVVPQRGADRDSPAAFAGGEVARTSLFSVLESDSLPAHARMPTKRLAADERLYVRGGAATSVYTVTSGIVRFERVTEGGERRIVRLAGPGDLIGQEALVPAPYAEDAVACTPVELCRIPCSLVHELGRSSDALRRELMQRWQSALEQSQSWVADLVTGTARRRMLKLLAHLERLSGAAEEVWLPRRQEMAAMLDVTVETASRLVHGLRREGVLQLLQHGAARLDHAVLQDALRAADAH